MIYSYIKLASFLQLPTGSLWLPVDAVSEIILLCGVLSTCLAWEKVWTPATDAMMLDLDVGPPGCVPVSSSLCYANYGAYIYIFLLGGKFFPAPS